MNGVVIHLILNLLVMKTLKTYFKTISYLLTFLILLQGCTVYKKQNISLEQAAAIKDKVKLVTKENEKQKYLYVTTINQEYYGIKKVNSELTKIPLQEENLEIVRTEDKVASTFTSLLAFAGGLIRIEGLSPRQNHSSPHSFF